MAAAMVLARDRAARGADDPVRPGHAALPGGSSGMRRPGFALLTVLWVVLALGVLGTLALHEAAAGSLTSRNRILLARAEWGRRACEQILGARYAERGAIIPLDTVDLGRGTWCSASPSREAHAEGSLLQVHFSAG